MNCPISKANLTPKDDRAHTASGVFFWYLDAVLNLFISRGCSSMVEHQLPKLNTWVRFPSPAPSFH